ncbi:apolipoprotein D-like [Eriocheir sinensis]|uniref:apolipoprotein D-like n=1 Tax=Eriocheir sinensis TaxID=95602 RepID=UPI0021C919EA|nr:apolipoprotein D-like [Eriocheir sinensis]
MQGGRGVTLALVAVGVLAATTSAHMLGLGSCREFEGMANFKPADFNGTWYVIKKVVTGSKCLSVNYNVMGNGEKIRVEEVRRPPYTDIVPVDLAVTNAGVLNRKNSPSKFSVTWYNGIMPVTGTYIIVDTDYTTYAIDYECQEILSFLKRQSATILSRKPTMDEAKINELVNKVSSNFDIPKGRMNRIDQENCIDLEANDFNLVIDEQGFKSALESYKELETLADTEGVAELVKSGSAEKGAGQGSG